MNHLKRFLFLVLILLGGRAIAGGDNGYSIKFKIKGLPKDSNCVMGYYFSDKLYIQDTAKSDANGQLVFEGKTKLKGGMYQLRLPKKKYLDFLMDQAQTFSIETDTADFVKYMKVKGCEETKLFYDYLGFLSAKQKEIEPLRKRAQKLKDTSDSTKLLSDQMSKIDKEVKAYISSSIKQHSKTFFGQMLKAMSDPEVPEAPKLSNGRPDSTFFFRYLRAHYFDTFDFTDERLLRTSVLFNKMKSFLDNMTYPIPDSISAAADLIVEKARVNKEMFQYVVYWITYTYESSSVLGMDAVFVHMAERYYLTGQAYWMDSTQLAGVSKKANTLKPLLIGKYAPNLILKDSNLREVTLYDVKANYTILYFWDYDCGHCKKYTPKLLEWYDKNKTKGIQVFAVGTETNADPWKKYVRENKLDWINVYDPTYQTGFKRIYDITSTPIMYVLDENKKIIANRRLEVDQLDGLLEHYSNQKKK